MSCVPPLGTASRGDRETGLERLGIVIIGRNEGGRLRRCLESLPRDGTPLVYVDSGSTDGSAALARQMGCSVVELDDSAPFTAARGRNAGLAWLRERYPAIAYVQFVDGDCELSEGWLHVGMETLRSRPEVAVVCGRVRERSPGTSVYTRLCHLEWDATVGEVDWCGGVAMMRVAALRDVNGFDPRWAAAEEPELSARLQGIGGKLVRITNPMARHDSGMMSFAQWWCRAVRAGQGYTCGMRMSRSAVQRLCVRRTCGVLFWAGVLPCAALFLAPWTQGFSFLLLLAHAVPAWRVFRRRHGTEHSRTDRALEAVFTMLGKFAQLVGVLTFELRRMAGRPDFSRYEKRRTSAEATASPL